jgi:hypothetical protein
MGNMPYCRFQNTIGDLDDCIESIKSHSNLDQWELEAAKDMYKSCIEFIEEAKDIGFRDEDNIVHKITDE